MRPRAHAGSTAALAAALLAATARVCFSAARAAAAAPATEAVAARVDAQPSPLRSAKCLVPLEAHESPEVPEALGARVSEGRVVKRWRVVLAVTMPGAPRAYARALWRNHAAWAQGATDALAEVQAQADGAPSGVNYCQFDWRIRGDPREEGGSSAPGSHGRAGGEGARAAPGTQQHPDAVAPSWSKLFVIRALLRHAEWVVHLDHDVLVMRAGVPGAAPVLGALQAAERAGRDLVLPVFAAPLLPETALPAMSQYGDAAGGASGLSWRAFTEAHEALSAALEAAHGGANGGTVEFNSGAFAVRSTAQASAWLEWAFAGPYARRRLRSPVKEQAVVMDWLKAEPVAAAERALLVPMALWQAHVGGWHARARAGGGDCGAPWTLHAFGAGGTALRLEVLADLAARCAPPAVATPLEALWDTAAGVSCANFTEDFYLAFWRDDARERLVARMPRLARYWRAATPADVYVSGMNTTVTELAAAAD